LECAWSLVPSLISVGGKTRVAFSDPPNPRNGLGVSKLGPVALPAPRFVRVYA
jgi:hypothetical protein